MALLDPAGEPSLRRRRRRRKNSLDEGRGETWREGETGRKRENDLDQHTFKDKATPLKKAGKSLPALIAFKEKEIL